MTVGEITVGNLRVAGHYSPKSMHAYLEELAAEGKLTLEKILIVKIIKGWIGRYSANFKKKVSEKTLVKNMENNQSTTVTESSIDQKQLNKYQKRV
ncbi:hypothetical protein C1645_829402 [Glomus cerebriforme]|uniref:Uncharacterized protein n=1 Tax=Glomus cerebriforme TaxID=658196 RepID=A0A397SJN5_9GLOM|nr:hypothetical protein C1645_829402 [Glomus cerebriforme]